MMQNLLLLLGLLTLVGVVLIHQRVRRGIKRTDVRPPRAVGADMPTVSVCIPARNEAHALARCLEQVLASDYQKLEILVLDDNSRDDTSILIKSFAHAGVRFIAGKALPSGWLGKNHALDVMAREASGEVVVFMDVDTAIETTTISRLIGLMQQQKRVMLSVIPARRDTARAGVIFGSLRYFWELLLASNSRPASSSALWAIDRRILLDEFGGFHDLAHYVQPEAALAARLQPAGRYQAFIGAPQLGVYYEKRWSSQIETSERLLYPLLSRSARIAALVLMAIIAWLAAGLGLITALLLGNVSLIIIFGLAVLLSFHTYAMYLKATRRSRRLLSLLTWPYVSVQEAWLIVTSLVRYKTGRVVWKGRSVTAAFDNRDALVIDE